MRRENRSESVQSLAAFIAGLEAKQSTKYKQGRFYTLRAAKRRLAARMMIDNPKSGDGVRVGNAPPNLPEQAFEAQALREGWTVTKRGWPDFLCWRGDEVVFVEVKPDGGEMSEYQKLVMSKLSSIGLKCFRWSPINGFTRIR